MLFIELTDVYFMSTISEKTTLAHVSYVMFTHSTYF